MRMYSVFFIGLSVLAIGQTSSTLSLSARVAKSINIGINSKRAPASLVTLSNYGGGHKIIIKDSKGNKREYFSFKGKVEDIDLPNKNGPFQVTVISN